MSEPLNLRFFGTFEARLGDEVLELMQRNSQQMVAYLAYYNRSLPADSVRSLFWAIDDRAFDSCINFLKNKFAHHGWRLISRGRTRDRTIEFISGEGTNCDIIQFKESIKIQITTPESAETVSKLLDISSIPFLDGWGNDKNKNNTFEKWVDRERLEINKMRSEAIWRLSQWYLEKENFEQVIAFLKSFVKLCPLRESGWCALMTLLLRMGERSEAKKTYKAYLIALEGDLILRASREMEALYEQALDNGGDAPPPELVARAGGAMMLGSRFYIQRPVDRVLQQHLRSGENIIVLQGPRLTGKSSLALRGLEVARRRGQAGILTHLDGFAQSDFSSLAAFCQALIASAQSEVFQLLETEQAPLPETNIGGPLAVLDNFVRYQLIAPFPQKIVWVIDGLDRVFGHAFQEDFFGRLRSWYNQRSFHTHWQRLVLILVCSTEPHLFIRDISSSPFNVGANLKIGDFGTDEATQLHERYGSTLRRPEDKEAFSRLLGMHPYLLGRGLDRLAQGMTVSDFMACASREDGPYGDHLRSLLELVKQDEEILAAIQSTLDKKHTPDRAFQRLRSAGILQGELGQVGQFRCQLYEQYFRSQLKETPSPKP